MFDSEWHKSIAHLIKIQPFAILLNSKGLYISTYTRMMSEGGQTYE